MLTYKLGEAAPELRGISQPIFLDDPVPERDDPLGPARGCLLGLLLSSIIWGGMFVIVLAIMKYK